MFRWQFTYSAYVRCTHIRIILLTSEKTQQQRSTNLTKKQRKNKRKDATTATLSTARKCPVAETILYHHHAYFIFQVNAEQLTKDYTRILFLVLVSCNVCFRFERTTKTSTKKNNRNHYHQNENNNSQRSNPFRSTLCTYRI